MHRSRPTPTLLLATLLAAISAPALAQGHPAAHQGVNLTGTWEAETADGPQRVVVRPDSTASFGDEVIWWLVEGDTVYLAFGDEWVGYHYVLRGRTLTLSGGDLEEPQDLQRVGPPTPLPDGVTPPPPPRRPAGSS